MIRLASIIIAPSVATPVFAEVCDKERPFWTGDSASIWSELVNLVLNPFFLAMISITAIVILLRTRIGAAICGVIWGLLSVVLFADGPTDPSGVHAFAVKEGCIGNPILSIALCAAICILTLYLALRPRRRPLSGET